MERNSSGYEILRRLFDGFDSYEIAAFFVDGGHWSQSIDEDSAAARVRACLNPDKNMFWKYSELRAWSVYTGRRVLVDDLCDGLGLMYPAADEGGRLSAIRGRLQAIEREREALLEEMSGWLPAGWSVHASDGVEELGTPDSVTQSRYSYADE